MIPGKPHWSVRYFVDKLNKTRWERQHPGRPWLTPQAIDILDDWIKPDDKVLEYGTGRSTAWFAARAKSVVAVEQSSEWYEIVRDDLEGKNLAAKVDLKLVPGEKAVDAYSGVALTYPDSYFDVVIVDGHFRRECIVKSLMKIRPGGILVYDDCQVHADAAKRAPDRQRAFQPLHTRTEEHRLRWEPVFESLDEWRLIWTTDGLKDTSIWVRPMP